MGKINALTPEVSENPAALANQSVASSGLAVITKASQFKNPQENEVFKDPPQNLNAITVTAESEAIVFA
jgi:hypothetical protein